MTGIVDEKQICPLFLCRADWWRESGCRYCRSRMPESLLLLSVWLSGVNRYSVILFLTNITVLTVYSDIIIIIHPKKQMIVRS